MSKLLDEAVQVVRSLPAESQDEIAQAMLRLTGRETAPEVVQPDHLAAILEGLEQSRSGCFASAQEVEAAFRRFDP